MELPLTMAAPMTVAAEMAGRARARGLEQREIDEHGHPWTRGDTRINVLSRRSGACSNVRSRPQAASSMDRQIRRMMAGAVISQDHCPSNEAIQSFCSIYKYLLRL